MKPRRPISPKKVSLALSPPVKTPPAASPLYAVDLSVVVSKYAAETEANLAAIFERAKASGAALYIDEADAVFGKRTNIKESHHRYANLDAQLLQRLAENAGVKVIVGRGPCPPKCD